jgi:hypothetical protein
MKTAAITVATLARHTAQKNDFVLISFFHANLAAYCSMT